MDPIPLHCLTRHQVVYPVMASEAFLRDHADRYLAQTRRVLQDRAGAMRADAVALDACPGFLVSCNVARNILVLFEEATGRMAGGIAAGTIWVDPEFQGRGLGSQALIAAFASGVKTVDEGAFFSPSGYANRSAAHRAAVMAALARGEDVPAAIAGIYLTPEGTHPDDSGLTHRQFREDLPRTAALPGPGWPSAVRRDRLRAESGRYPDGDSFADHVLETARPMEAWEVRDRQGCLVDRCTRAKAAIYGGLREYTLSLAEPVFDPDFPGEYRRAHARVSELWTKWEQEAVRGCLSPAMLGRVQGRFAVAARCAAAIATECGPGLARPCRADRVPSWVPGRRRAGFEIKVPDGTLWISVREIGTGRHRVEALCSGPGSADGLVGQAAGVLEDAAGRGLPIDLAHGAAPCPVVVDLPAPPELSLPEMIRSP